MTKPLNRRKKRIKAIKQVKLKNFDYSDMFLTVTMPERFYYNELLPNGNRLLSYATPEEHQKAVIKAINNN